MPTAGDAHLYDRYYYEHGCGGPYQRTPECLEFYAKIAEAIVRQIGPRTVLDAGCAYGFIVEALRDRGIEAFGLDISKYAIQNVREDIRPYVRVASLLDPLPERYDLIVCIEVLEHLTAIDGEQAIENLCRASDDVLFCSTPEDYREATHFNVRPPDYWSTLFALHGFVRDVDFDASFLTPWAVRFRRNHEPMHRVLGVYDRKFWVLWKENTELRQQNVKMREQSAADADLLAQAQALHAQVQTLTTRLDAVTHSKGWALVLTLRQWRLKLAPLGSRREGLLRLFLRGLRVWKTLGFSVLMERAADKFVPAPGRRIWHRVNVRMQKRRVLDADRRRYQKWLSEDVVTSRVREFVQADIGHFEYRPLFSLVMPVHDPPLRFLREAIQSVRQQLYGDWELCIANDGSDAKVAKELQRWTRLDPRIRLQGPEKNQGISEAASQGSCLATGEFVGRLGQVDVLAQTCLYYLAKALNEDRTGDLFYIDEDNVTEDGTRLEPRFKPDWSPHTLLSHNYIGRFWVCRRTLLDRVGLSWEDIKAAEDYDLILRLTEKTNNIHHVPKVLYSWRKPGGSDTPDPELAAEDAGRRAVQQALARRGCEGTVASAGLAGSYKVAYALKGHPLVSVVISTCTVSLLRRCWASLQAKTTYRNREVLVATNAMGNAELRQYCAENDLRLVEVVDGFFSKMNNAAAEAAHGEYIVFLNDDTEIVTPQWIEEMLSLCQQSDIAAVGPKLVLPDGRIWVARIAMGIRRDGVPYFFDPFMGSQGVSAWGFSPQVISDVSGLSGACMMVKKAPFLAVGGFNTKQFNLNVQDMDLCLQLREKGYSILYTPHAVVVHHVATTKRRVDGLLAQDAKILQTLFENHRDLLLHGDPFYNPNLLDVHGLVEPPRFPGLERLDMFDAYYDRSYWENYGFPIWRKGHWISNRASFVNDIVPFASSIVGATGCQRIVDVGCGQGLLIEAFQTLGVEAWGIEASRDGLEYVPAAVRKYIIQGNVSSPGTMARVTEQGPFSVAVCSELLEHIPMDDLDRVIENITTLSDTIIVTTPKPNLWDRDDKTHVSVMPRDFWMERFKRVGYLEDSKIGERIFGGGYELNSDIHRFLFRRG